jgi:hypothetical protein
LSRLDLWRSSPSTVSLCHSLLGVLGGVFGPKKTCLDVDATGGSQ